MRATLGLTGREAHRNVARFGTLRSNLETGLSFTEAGTEGHYHAPSGAEGPTTRRSARVGSGFSEAPPGPGWTIGFPKSVNLGRYGEATMDRCFSRHSAEE